jgi:hypothetical protein
MNMNLLKIACRIAGNDPGSISTTVEIRWKEPIEGSSIIQTNLNMDEMNQVIKWLKQEAGKEWGGTIPSVEIVNEQPDFLDVHDFASAIRYEDSVYQTNCPVFENKGIIRR